jgi:predicted ATPase
LLNQLEAEARRRPVLMVFEDAHWIDPTSREVLDLSVDRVRHLPVLLVISFRPEFHPPWGGRSHVMNMELNRLGEREGEALVHKLADGTSLTAEIVAEIVERTDGVPLFIEELTKAVLESAGQSDRVTAGAGGCIAGRAVGTGDLACLVDGAARPARAGAQGGRADRRGARPRVFL